MKNGVIIVNTARAGLVDQNIIQEGVKSGKIKGYLTDVLEEEPMVKDHPFLNHENILITPHIGSRTYENVVNQGTMAVENLLKYLNGKSIS
jgi:D-3-phosphoglycerate dehydrogenase